MVGDTEEANEFPRKLKVASLRSNSFECPHCGAFTHQYWHTMYADRLNDYELPFLPNVDYIEKLRKDPKVEEPRRAEVMRYCERLISGKIFLEGSSRRSGDILVGNVHLSKCYTCNEIAVWVHEKMVHPPRRTGPAPNEDLPESIRADFEEARSILDLSPRGAAALLRLCVEKLCVHVKADGATLNDKIADLVKKGLNVKVQQSLDAVRVIGNDAVHPGRMDLEDDRGTAESLFRLVNLIAEKMISEPKHIEEVYGSLPAPKLAAIQKRDGSE